MAYATASDVKTYLGIGTTADDALIATCVTRAQAGIENYTHRKFEASADTVHYFSVGVDTDGRTLYLDDDLCAITSVVTNADNAAPTTLLATEYTTEPRNQTPYHIIRLLGSSTHGWTYTTDHENGIEVTGKWAYSTTPPGDVVQACVRWAAYMYRQKDAQVFDVTAQPDMGVITIPQGIPADVKMLLEPYRRVW